VYKFRKQEIREKKHIHIQDTKRRRGTILLQIDICTAKFLEKFMTSDNYICRLFECHARIGLNKFFSMYDNASSALDVRRAADRLFFC